MIVGENRLAAVIVCHLTRPLECQYEGRSEFVFGSLDNAKAYLEHWWRNRGRLLSR